MRHLFRRLALLGGIVGLVWAATAWPRLDEVETGRTREYQDLNPRRYTSPTDAVVRAVKAAAAQLPRWEVVGVGSGPAGAEVKAVKTEPLVPLKYDVWIRVRPDKGRTLVTVRSKSRLGPWDFGANARNIREFLKALDREVF